VNGYKGTSLIIGCSSRTAGALRLKLPRGQEDEKLLDVAAMATALAVELAYCGRLMG